MAGELDTQTQIEILSQVATFSWLGSVAIAYYAGKWRGQLKELGRTISILEKSGDREVSE